MVLEKIQSDLREAMKAKDEAHVSALRFLLAQIKNKEIELFGQGKELTDEEVMSVIQKQAKERKESIEAFKKAGRDDLVGKEEAELLVLSIYLPQQLSPEELEKIIREVIASLGATSGADFGKVMGQVMGKVKGRADGNMVTKLVKEKLDN